MFNSSLAGSTVLQSIHQHIEIWLETPMPTADASLDGIDIETVTTDPRSQPSVSTAPLGHSYASAALASAEGWHEAKVISQRLGHATVAIALDTYSHVLPAADVTVAHTLARVILSGD